LGKWFLVRIQCSQSCNGANLKYITGRVTELNYGSVFFFTFFSIAQNLISLLPFYFFFKHFFINKSQPLGLFMSAISELFFHEEKIDRFAKIVNLKPYFIAFLCCYVLTPSPQGIDLVNPFHILKNFHSLFPTLQISQFSSEAQKVQSLYFLNFYAANFMKPFSSFFCQPGLNCKTRVFLDFLGCSFLAAKPVPKRSLLNQPLGPSHSFCRVAAGRFESSLEKTGQAVQRPATEGFLLAPQFPALAPKSCSSERLASRQSGLYGLLLTHIWAFIDDRIEEA
jgi:hypothetical protein